MLATRTDNVNSGVRRPPVQVIVVIFDFRRTHRIQIVVYVHLGTEVRIEGANELLARPQGRQEEEPRIGTVRRPIVERK